jgi:hypothetical protein
VSQGTPERRSNSGMKSLQTAQRKMNITELMSVNENDKYLGEEEGQQPFTTLINAARDIKQATSPNEGFASKNWVEQFDACNTIRNALRFHPENISKSQAKYIFEKLWQLLDSPRSQVAKNAMLTLADCFAYLEEGYISEAEIQTSFTKLIKKTADANQFLAQAADHGLFRITQNTQPLKSIQLFNRYYDDKAWMLRRAVSKCLEQIMNNIGSKNINVMQPGHVQKQLFKIINYYINDSN